MLKNILKLTKHSAIYGIGHILGRTIGFLLLPLHTNYILPEKYALYVYGYALIPIIAILYSAGINSAQLKFALTSNNEQEKTQIFATSFYGTIFISIILSLTLFLFSKNISILVFSHSDNISLVHYIICILLFDALSLILYNILRAYENSFKFITISLINIIINIGLNYVYIVHLNEGIRGIFISNLWASLSTLILLIITNRRYLVPYFSWPIFKKLFQFGLPIIPSTISMVILTVIDRFIIKDLLGDEAAGIYGAGYKLGMFMSLVITAFRYAWYPFYLSTAATESNAKQIFSKIFTYFVFVCLSIFLLISFFIKELVQMRIFGYTIFGEEYWPSIVIVPTILASYIFYGLYLNFQIGIYLTNKTKNLAIITIISALINIILNYLLIPYMGISGAALTTLVSYGFMAITIYFISNKLYNIHYEWKRITQITLITLTIFFTSQVTFIDNSFILKLVLFISYFIILISTSFFEKHEFKVLNEVIRKKIWHN